MRFAAASSTDAPLTQAGDCALCLMAAAFDGGALPSAPIPLLPPQARHEAPLAALSDGWPGSPAPPYRSQAPPASSF
jgi:hypothetical protein